MRRYNPAPGLMSIREAAERLAVSGAYVRYLIAVGDLPAQSVGNRYVLNVADVNALNERRTARRAWRTIHNAQRGAGNEPASV